MYSKEKKKKKKKKKAYWADIRYPCNHDRIRQIIFNQRNKNRKNPIFFLIWVYKNFVYICLNFF